MHAALHHQDRSAFQLPADQPPRMALHGRDREIGNLMKRDEIGIFDRFGQRGQARAQHDAEFRVMTGMLAHVARDSVNLIMRDKYVHGFILLQLGQQFSFRLLIFGITQRAGLA